MLYISVSGSISPVSNLSSTSSDDKSGTKMMEDRSKSANYNSRQPTVIMREATMRSIAEKPHSATAAEIKSANIGLRAMSAQDRSSLNRKMEVEEEARRLSEAKSRVVKGKPCSFFYFGLFNISVKKLIYYKNIYI